MRINAPYKRSGAHLVECALVFPIALFLLLFLLVGGLGIYKYQQVCQLARNAARFAACHGGQYAQENASAIAANTLPSVDETYITNNLVVANATNMNASDIQVSVNFNMSSGSYDWDNTAQNGNRWPNSAKTINGVSYNETNTVSVTVQYTWTPEWFLVGPFTLSSTAVVPMCY
jgi:Flp pilus assembly protein TadG